MTQKKPKDSSFYDRFKFDNELFEEVFTKKDRTEKALLYLTALVKSVLPQQASAPITKKPQQKNKALERIKETYKKEDLAKQPKPPTNEKKVNTEKKEAQSTKSPTFKQTAPKINVAASKTNLSEKPVKKIVLQPQTPNKKPQKERIPPRKKIKFKTFLNNVKLVLNYLNPISKNKPEKLKTTKLDDSLKRLKERERKIQELFDKNKGKLS